MDINQYLNLKDPVDKLVREAQGSIVSSAEHAITGELAKALQRVGLGEISNKNVLGQLGEEILSGIAGEIFGTIGKELNLSSKSEIESLRGVLVDDDPNRADIDKQSVSRIKQPRETYIYPPDLNDFYVQMDFKKYRRPAPHVTATVETEFSVCLPLPRTLEDRHNISYNDNVQLGVVGMIANQGQNGVNKNGNLDVGTATAWVGRELVKTSFGGEALLALLTQTVGAQLNPHISVMFEAPTLRRHKMQWLLAPNNEEESDRIRKLVKKIKSASLPAYAVDQNGNSNINILQFPMMCKITLFPWGDSSKSSAVGSERQVYDSHMYTFKHCVIDSVSVNYAPDNLAFFESDTNAPAFISLDISFLEIEYFTAEDFGRTGTQMSLDDVVGDISKDILGESDDPSVNASQIQNAIDTIPPGDA